MIDTHYQLINYIQVNIYYDSIFHLDFEYLSLNNQTYFSFINSS
jgi:hypothetical protein